MPTTATSPASLASMGGCGTPGQIDGPSRSRTMLQRCTMQVSQGASLWAVCGVDKAGGLSAVPVPCAAAADAQLLPPTPSFPWARSLLSHGSGARLNLEGSRDYGWLWDPPHIGFLGGGPGAFGEVPSTPPGLCHLASLAAHPAAGPRALYMAGFHSVVTQR